jgi:hypothetical protein
MFRKRHGYFCHTARVQACWFWWALFYFFFNVNLVVPLARLSLLRSSDQNCTSVGCVADSNVAYSSELKVNSSGGEIDACKCVCKAFGSPHNCASVNYQIIFCAGKFTISQSCSIFSSLVFYFKSFWYLGIVWFRWNHEELRKIAENGSWFYPKKNKKKKKKGCFIWWLWKEFEK